MEEFIAANGTLIALVFTGVVVIVLTFLYTHNTLIRGLINSIPVETIERYLNNFKSQVDSTGTKVDDIAYEVALKILSSTKELQQTPPPSVPPTQD